VIEDCIRSD